VVNEKEAETIQYVFKRYLELNSIRLLQHELAQSGITSKIRRHEDGTPFGGQVMRRGAVEYLLKNKIYLGKIIHKGEHFDGQHKPIVSHELFDSVQHQLAVLGPGESARKKLASPSILQGLVFDAEGARLQPTHSNKQGRKYRYYVSSSIIRDVNSASDGLRIPAIDLERLILRTVSSKLKDMKWVGQYLAPGDAQQASALITRSGALARQVENLANHNTGILKKVVQKISVNKRAVEIELNQNGVRQALELGPTEPTESELDSFKIRVPSHLLRCGKQVKLIIGEHHTNTNGPDQRLVREVVQARQWHSALSKGKVETMARIAKSNGCSPSHVSRKITLAMLAPDILEMILTGTQPVSLTPERLKKACPLPASWDEQRALLIH